MKRSLQAWVLEVAVAIAVLATVSVITTFVMVGLLDLGGWPVHVAQVVVGGLVGWRLAAWGNRQDALEAKRSEVDR